MITTRFAPSPTGYIHIGNCRTALFSYLWMLHERQQEKQDEKSDSRFILRIEDTDSERSKDEYVTELCRNLADLGITWDVGPDPDPAVEAQRTPEEKRAYTQSLRTDIYAKYYQQLIDAGFAYKCFCTEQTLKMVRKRQVAKGEPPRYSGTCRSLSQEEITKKEEAGLQSVLRFKVDTSAEIKFSDRVKGAQKFLGKNIGDFVIRKSGGEASFMFANAVDDALMGVNLVIRGDDHLSNTPYQIMILQTLGLPIPEYAHISLINGSDGAPLSKRNGSQSIKDLLLDVNYFIEDDNESIDNTIGGSNNDERVSDKIDKYLYRSCLPQALLNSLARLGCAYDSEELMDLQDLAKNFNPNKLARSPARYDNKQLRHWQTLAMHKLLNQIIAGDKKSYYAKDVLKYVDHLFIKYSGPLYEGPFLKQIDKIQFIRTYKDGIYCLKNLDNYTHLAGPPGHLDIRMRTPKEADSKFISLVIDVINNAPSGSIDELRESWKDITKQIQEKSGRKGKELFLPLRIGITASPIGPPLNEFYALIGKEEAIKRFNSFAEHLIAREKNNSHK